MVVRISGFFHRILESEVDDMIVDLRTLLNANEHVFSFNIHEDMEYQGEVGEPAGIIGGKLEVIADIDDMRSVADEIFSTFWAYQQEVSVQIDI